MKIKIGVILIALLSINVMAENTNIVFRQPFVQKLRIDKDIFYRQQYPKVPYVADQCVYIFPGEHFKVGLTFSGDEIKISYDEKSAAKSFFEFNFKTEFQEKSNEVHSFLIGKNNSEKKVTYDALMILHDAQTPQKTSIIPTESGLENYEHWPYPIMQLMLYNFRVVDEVDASLEAPYPQKRYAAIFRIKLDESGALIDFGLEKVIDPSSESIEAVDITLPEEYLVSAKTHVLARGYKPQFKDGQPVAFYDHLFYDPQHPDEVIGEGVK